MWNMANAAYTDEIHAKKKPQNDLMQIRMRKKEALLFNLLG